MRKQRFTYTGLTSLMFKWDYYVHNHYITSCFSLPAWRKVLWKELYGLLHPQNVGIVHTLTIGIHEQFTMRGPSSAPLCWLLGNAFVFDRPAPNRLNACEKSSRISARLMKSTFHTIVLIQVNMLLTIGYFRSGFVMQILDRLKRK